MLAGYFTSRRFRSPFRSMAEGVGPRSALWAFLLGPIYYWRKRAPIEALLFAIVLGVPLFVDDDGGVLGLAGSIDLGSAIWVTFALAAPILLPACYRRKGWVEVEIGTLRAVREFEDLSASGRRES